MISLGLDRCCGGVDLLFCNNSGIGIKILHILHNAFFNMDCEAGGICVVVAEGLFKHMRRYV